MRGGLGRTLLTAFLILTILPLTLTVSYAVQQNRENVQREVESKLLAVAALKGEELERWFDDLQSVLLLSVKLADNTDDYTEWWTTLTQQIPDLTGVVVWQPEEQSRWTAGECAQAWDQFRLTISGANLFSSPAEFAVSDLGATVFLPIEYQDRSLLFCMDGAMIERVIHHEGVSDGTTRVYLIHKMCLWPSTTTPCSQPMNGWTPGGQPGSGTYVNNVAIAVTGAYYPLPNADVGILVEQPQSQTLESVELIAATFIALVLAVALVTTAIAAVVIRQITLPVIRLTESALAMAEGELDQHLAVTSRDEIGILTYVFNDMAAQLKSLYADLEAKVVDRTRMLQRANYQIQRRALHLQASQEVSQAITSVRDPDLLFMQMADLIRDSFMYASVAIYMVEPGGGAAALNALSPDVRGARPSAEGEIGGWADYVYPGDGSTVERAIRKRVSQVEHQETHEEVDWYRRTLSRVAVPLRMGERVIGAIAALSTEHEGVQPDELEVLELLANQIAIAVENARAYERERVATQHLEEAEAFKARFLANMSHALREPLNTVIGFSRLLIKGVDGPLTELQQQDMERVYADSQRLLFLINDILAISQIQAGLMELKLQPIHLIEVVAGVMPTATALVQGKDVELVRDIPEDLPLLRIDPSHIRQVLVHLLNNAAKFTYKGRITLRAWYRDDWVYVSVSDTGVGIPPEDLERIFVRFNQGSARRNPQQGAGLGLALCKEFVEMHGGQIWAQSRVDEGSMFTFSLPCYGEALTEAEKPMELAAGGQSE